MILLATNWDSTFRVDGSVFSGTALRLNIAGKAVFIVAQGDLLLDRFKIQQRFGEFCSGHVLPGIVFDFTAGGGTLIAAADGKQ